MSTDPPVPELHPLPVDLSSYRAALPTRSDVADGSAAAARALARAIATGPAGARLACGSVVVRQGADPCLGVLARVRAEDRSWLAAAIRSLEHSVRWLRWVSWPEVEAAAESLAGELRRRVGPKALETAAVRGIPRGGLVAAGLVAYALDLPRRALDREVGAGHLTVVVDDCALTGARFRELTATRLNGPVVFAPLFSTPALREAVEAAEESVAACVSGRDLVDHAPRHLGADHGAWLRAWRRRSGDRVYWVGQPDHLVFPWSEPDVSVWDESREEEAPGFSVAPPELCLTRRAGAGRGPDVQLQPKGEGEFRPAPGLLWGELDGVVVIRDVEAGRVLTLQGTAAAMWDALVREPTARAAAATVARRYGAPEDRVLADLEDLAEGLVERRAMVERGDGVPGASGVAPTEAAGR